MSRYNLHHMILHTVHLLSKITTHFPQRYPERINNAYQQGRHILQSICSIHVIAQC